MYGQMTIIRLAADGATVKKGDTICVLSGTRTGINVSANQKFS